MKHRKLKSKDEKADEIRLGYDLALLLKEGGRGTYTKRCEQGTTLVLLSPDVARDFPNDEAVNEALRLVIQLKIYVLHAFQKKTRKTSKQDIDLARQRYKQIGG